MHPTPSVLHKFGYIWTLQSMQHYVCTYFWLSMYIFKRKGTQLQDG
jgi:hypothetical protein